MPLLLACCLALLAGPLHACLNDSEVVRGDGEFRAGYDAERSATSRSRERVMLAATITLGGCAATLIGLGIHFRLRERHRRVRA